MPDAVAPESNPERPLPSAFAVIRAILFSPRNFLVGAVTGVLTATVAILSGLLFGEVSAGEVVLTALEVLFTLLSPFAVGAAAGMYAEMETGATTLAFASNVLCPC